MARFIRRIRAVGIVWERERQGAAGRACESASSSRCALHLNWYWRSTRHSAGLFAVPGAAK